MDNLVIITFRCYVNFNRYFKLCTYEKCYFWIRFLFLSY